MTVLDSRGDPAVGRPHVDPRDPGRRVAALLDAGSVRPMRCDDGSGVVTARGTVGGTDVVVYCTDATTMGGAMGVAGCEHIVEAIESARAAGCPVIGLWHCGGARLAEGVASLNAVGLVFAAMIRASGRVPQISVVLGPAAGGAAYGPALTDMVIMAPAGRVFVTGPDVVRSVTGECIDQEGLGGAEAHGKRSGVVHVLARSEADAIARARALTDLVSRPVAVGAVPGARSRDVASLLPQRARRAYDVKPVIGALLDDDPTSPGSPVFEELQAGWAPNVVVGVGRLGGRTVGVVANNPIRKGGCLDSLAAEKAARFIRMCDSMGVPLLVLVDVPGYLPGVEQEWGGVVRRGAKLLHAFGEAVVPRVTLILRKSFGGAYIAMNSHSLGATAVFAWPGAEVAVMGAEAAVGVLHRKQLASVPESERCTLAADLAAQHQQTAGGVGRAVSIGVVESVIDPADTRSVLVDAFTTATPCRGNHGNIPL